MKNRTLELLGLTDVAPLADITEATAERHTEPHGDRFGAEIKKEVNARYREKNDDNKIQ